ncbi:MAG: phosphotransferase [Caldilineaceae bacterium]
MREQAGVRILVVDNDERVGADITEMGERWGWQVEVVRTSPANMVERAHMAAFELRPHVAIVDVRLLDDYEDDRSGLQVLEFLRSARCILYSGYLTVDIVRSAQRTYAQIEEVIGKHEPPDMLERAIQQAIAKSSARHSHHQIEWRSQRPLQRLQSMPLGDAGMVSQEMVEDLLCRLFPTVHRLTIDAISRDEAASGLTARIDSLVLKVTRDDLEPVALRVAWAQRIEEEVARYHDFIDQRLAGLFYAQLVAHDLFWQIGGAVYSFLGAVQAGLPTFSAFYAQKEEPAEIAQPLRTFFTKSWQRYYQDAQPLAASTLFAAYDEVLNLRPKLETLTNDSSLTEFPINPAAWALQNASTSTATGARQAVTHGDLHGDNLFVDEDHAWVIDFERCGPGPILRDFVELEVDILTRLIGANGRTPPLYDTLLRVLVNQSRPDQVLICPADIEQDATLYKAFCVIIHIRRLAFEVAKFGDMHEYLWGILLDALFAAFLAHAMPERRLRALKLAAVLTEKL